MKTKPEWMKRAPARFNKVRKTKTVYIHADKCKMFLNVGELITIRKALNLPMTYEIRPCSICKPDVSTFTEIREQYANSKH